MSFIQRNAFNFQGFFLFRIFTVFLQFLVGGRIRRSGGTAAGGRPVEEKGPKAERGNQRPAPSGRDAKLQK